MLDARGDSFEEEGMIADVSEPDRIADVFGDDLWILSGEFYCHHVVPIPSFARKVLCWITCCDLRCVGRRVILSGHEHFLEVFFKGQQITWLC